MVDPIKGPLGLFVTRGTLARWRHAWHATVLFISASRVLC